MTARATPVDVALRRSVSLGGGFGGKTSEIVLARHLSPFFVVLVILAAILGSACGSSGGNSATPTPAAQNTAPSAPTAVPTPLVFGAHVNSAGVGYEADIPPGWHLRPNIITSQTFRGDAYFKDEPGTPDPNKGATNVSVGCAPKTPDTGTLEDELALELKGLQQLKRENIRSGDHPDVAGKAAKQIDFVYRLNTAAPTPIPPTPPGPPISIALDQRLIVVMSDACVWKITLSTPVGGIDSEVPVLEKFLESLKLNA